MHVFIFLHGDRSDTGFYREHLKRTKEKTDVIICADGGYDIARSLHIKPHLVVGDLDSLAGKKIEEGIKVVRYPAVKDYSDFELSLKEALLLEPQQIFVYGALGGRKDHEIINLSLIAHTRVPAILVEREVEIYNVVESLTLIDKKGSVCSLVAMSEGCRVQTMRGFRFILHKEVLLPSSRGLSNVITETEASISIKSGQLLVIVNNVQEEE